MDKIELAIKLKGLEEPAHLKVKMEQYTTDVYTAVEFLSFVESAIGFDKKTVADFGSGKGILGIGAAMLGAASVEMYDLDGSMVRLANRNVKATRVSGCRAYKKDLFDVSKTYDIVISNPPFGFQSTFNIRAFIKKLKEAGRSFFFIYKLNQEIYEIARENSILVEYLGGMSLPRTAFFHKKENVVLPTCVVYKV